MPNWQLYIQNETDRKPTRVATDYLATTWPWYINVNGVRHEMRNVDMIDRTVTYRVDGFKIRDLNEPIPNFDV